MIIIINSLVVASVTSDVLLGEELSDSKDYSDYFNAFYGYYSVRSRLLPLQLIEYYYYFRSYFYSTAEIDKIHPSQSGSNKSNGGFKSFIIKDE
jgi:hypothetical protein